MKKLIATMLVAVVALIGSYQAKAIEDPFAKGTVIAGAHFAVLPGIGTTVYGDYVLVDSWWKGHFSVGAEFGYTRKGYYDVDVDIDDLFNIDVKTKKIKANEFAVLTRANYGLNITDRFEVHAGFLLGMGITPNSPYYDKNCHFAIGGTMGIRYFFTDFLAGSFEMQYTGYSPILNLGVAFKF